MKSGRIWAIVIGAVAIGVLLAGHLLLPVAGSWKLNRVLHYVWIAVTALAGAGGVTAFLWPRAKLPRRDLERRRARERVVSIIVTVVITFAIISFGEVRRAMVTERYLASARQDLQRIRVALEAYGADHNGARPEKLADLAPKYLKAEELYYGWRDGPVAANAPSGTPAAEPSYVVVPKEQRPEDEKEPRREVPLLVYQRPGESWAPMVAALYANGTIKDIGEDDVARMLEGPTKGVPRRR